MQLNLKELIAKESTVRLKETLDVSDLLKGRQDYNGSGPLEADLQATASSGVVEVSGQLTIDVDMACSRCLESARQTLHIPYREWFAEREEALSEEQAEEAHVVAEDRLDLKPYLVEAVWFQLPVVPLCQEDCEGLCPQCGINRNEHTCQCSTERIDPRLAGLADFFKETDAKE
ncbi:YceD family protein [Paenibacillus senegalensis]|uniref:YceD family protein n=1 Tax=Paenibacillus senegalensis TaxID=1465766 RepID=UPI000289A2AD|nr:DUF177 domain-containing protein [Paenibacillus senegalensis]